MESQGKKYCVYKHTNKFNGKVYIGITSRSPEIRWNHGRGYKNNEYFYRAIQKYGWDEGFIHEVVVDGLTKDVACKIETDLIAEYDSTNYKNGYNCSSGGWCGNAGCVRSDEWINKMKKSLRKSVVCVETGKIYDSATDAEIKTNISKSNIGESCRRHQRTAGGFHWCFLSDYYGKRDFFNEIKRNIEANKNRKRHMGKHT
jgi:hypothetical protein